MREGPLWQISVTTTREAEMAVGTLLEMLFGQTPSIYTQEETPISVATVYWSETAGRLLAKRPILEAGLDFLARCGLQLGPGKLVVRRVPREDWAESWKKYFKVIEIGSALLIRPSWSKRRPKPGQAVVTLDPGLSFGTGQHPTTAFCLRQLVAAKGSGQPGAFLDIGTGSGILAVAAVKLGYKPVRAFDNDAVAVRVAKENARKNRVERKLTILRQDLRRMRARAGEEYDVVCANLTDDLLMGHVDAICRCLRRSGWLVLAGVLESQFGGVRRAYERRGLRLRAEDRASGWHSGAFTFGGGAPVLHL